MKISEIFYSLQGEGSRKGEPSLFVRFSGCSAKHACFASGVMCDTEFESGSEMKIEELRDRLFKLSESCRWIVFTGGEPADQLTALIINYFRQYNYRFQIETSGVKKIAIGLNAADLISISPKVAEHVLEKNFPDYKKDNAVSIAQPKLELRYVRHEGQSIPEPSLSSDFRFLSPHFDGLIYRQENIDHCIKLCLDNPTWGLSIQEHKLLSIL